MMVAAVLRNKVRIELTVEARVEEIPAQSKNVVFESRKSGGGDD